MSGNGLRRFRAESRGAGHSFPSACQSILSRVDAHDPAAIVCEVCAAALDVVNRFRERSLLLCDLVSRPLIASLHVLNIGDRIWKKRLSTLHERRDIRR